MPFNLQPGYGLGEGADALEMQIRRLAEMADKKQRLKLEQQRVKIEQQHADTEQAYRIMDAESRAAARTANEQTQAQKGSDDFAARLPMGTKVGPAAKAKLAVGGMDGPEFLQHKDATLGSTNLSGPSVMTAKAPRILGLAKTPNPGQDASDTFLGTSAQKAAEQTRQDRLSEADAARSAKDAAAINAKTDKEDLIRLTASLRPAPQAPLVMMNTVDDKGNAVTRIVKKEAGAEYAKPANATTATRVAAAETVNQVGNDLIRKLSDPQFRAALGPALGRVGKVGDFIGNPPPAFSEFAGQIESYALANMGVHGMRSAQGAEQIKKLLDQRHTPESLAATIRGLNDFSTRFVQNNRPTSGAAPAAGAGGAAPKRVRYDMNGNPIKD